MMRQSGYKRKYNPEVGKRVKSHIYEEGLMDEPKKKKVSYKEPMPITLTKKNENAGDKIVEALRKETKKRKTKINENAGDKIIEALAKESKKQNYITIN